MSWPPHLKPKPKTPQGTKKMAFSISSRNYVLFFSSLPPNTNKSLPPISLRPFSSPKPPLLCLKATPNSPSAPNSPTSSPASANKKKKKKKKKRSKNPSDGFNLKDVEIIKADNFDDEEGEEDYDVEPSSSTRFPTTSLPKPPAGFVVDDTGRVLLVSDKRTVTIVDSTKSAPLECVIRRVFRSSKGDECMIVCPLDMPFHVLKSVNVDGFSAISEDEVEAVLPAVAYALAKVHMHLIPSGFCYTARGGFCYTEADLIDFSADDGQNVDGIPTEGIEITCFHLDGAHYMIYTPCDPVLFVAIKDHNGVVQMADDDLLDDPAIVSAIDEEIEFNALVEEESAFLDSLMGRI